MSQMLRRNKELNIDLLFTIEKKLCFQQHHKVNLLTYKKNKVPKGLLLKFKLALCIMHVLREQCNNILFNTSSQIRNKIMKALGKKINSLKKERKNLLNNIKTSFNHKENENIRRKIYNIKTLY